MGRVKDFYHEEICAGASDMGPEPHLQDEKDAAMNSWIALIYALPVYGRTAEQADALERARVEALAARDRFYAGANNAEI